MPSTCDNMVTCEKRSALKKSCSEGAAPSAGVSFGSNTGSMIETLIIDDCFPFTSDEKNFYERNIRCYTGNNYYCQEIAPVKHRVTFSDSYSPTETRKMANHTGGTQSPSSPTSPDTPLAPAPPSILITRPLTRSQSMESRDNPFQPDGDLSKEADDILKRSTISRTQVLIDDPEKSYDSNFVGEDSIQPTHVSGIESMPNSKIDQNQNKSGDVVRPGDIKLNENNRMDNATPQSVEVEVGIVVPAADSHMQVEHVKLKDKKKCECCIMM
ncbi:uncharacterized protein LOC135486682 isoform X2 [Lineus longissimus]|uniref:uncharacterized protein LOC135486682 isoform X2 n=1 Tax=Lineus longissimus TaxID=88925 RepID=UPI00315D751C